MSPTETLRRLFTTAVEAVSAEAVLPAHLPAPPSGRTVAIGFGKAAAAMARSFEDRWPAPVSGLAVTRYGHAVPCRRIDVIEAGHPVPDAAAAAAAGRALAAVSGLAADDLVVCLASGGGSALLCRPGPGITLADKRQITDVLLACGASIGEINCVRKHLSGIKGGRLAAAAAPAQVLTLAISDVPGDDPATIASGPAIADPSTADDARAILKAHGIAPTEPIRRLLASAAARPPGTLSNARAAVVARAADALEAAAAEARRLGLAPTVLGDDLTGEAAALGRAHAKLARRAPDGVILSGGETTVSLPRPGYGRGGRNTEYLLALALALDGAPGIHAIACDTDGLDGTEDNAGAIIGPDVLARAQRAGLDARCALAQHRSYDFFAALGALVQTGPTRTNVNDFRAILIDAGTVPAIDLTLESRSDGWQ